MTYLHIGSVHWVTAKVGHVIISVYGEVASVGKNVIYGDLSMLHAVLFILMYGICTRILRCGQFL